MALKFDPETLERFRSMTPKQIYSAVNEAVHKAPGSPGSEDFLDALDSLVDEGILSWDQIENFEDDEKE